MEYEMKIYRLKEDRDGTKTLNFLGIRLYKEQGAPYFKKRKYLGGLFKTLQNGSNYTYYILGIKLFKKRNQKEFIQNYFKNIEEKTTYSNKRLDEISNREEILNQIIIKKTQSAITVANQHQKVFPQFKNIHKGKECVIVATGPTLNYYEPIKDAIHIGVNSAFKKINLDYLFSIDYTTIKDDIEEIKNANFIKFLGQCDHQFPYPYYRDSRHIPNKIIEASSNSYKYYFDHWNYIDINIDIETQLLPDLGSSVFSTAYFALYTGVKKIYLVGCDCTLNGHWNDSKNMDYCMNILQNNWKKFKDYANTFYPDVEIVSINPIGLKGMFEEIYTQSYIDDYHEEDNETQEAYKIDISDDKDKSVFYLKVNSEAYFSLRTIQNWINVVEKMDADFYIICDKDRLKANILKNIKFKNENVKFIKSRRIRLSKIIENITTPNWRNAGFSHLTTFYHAKENGIKNFWNIDADDTIILEEPEKVVEILKNAQYYAEEKDISVFSLDMWRSRSRSKQWTFGITYTKNVDKLVDIFNSAKDNWMKKYEGLDNGLNIDWFVTYLDDNKIIKAGTFYIENCYFIHYANRGSFLSNTMGSQICYWKANKLYFPILNNVLKDENLGIIPIAKDCIKFDLGIEEESCLKFLNTNLQDNYPDELVKLWHIKDSKYANI